MNDVAYGIVLAILIVFALLCMFTKDYGFENAFPGGIIIQHYDHNSTSLKPEVIHKVTNSSSIDSNIVDFAIIGFPKRGTTFLRTRLINGPQLPSHMETINLKYISTISRATQTSSSYTTTSKIQ